ncbi:MAG: long-chain fatty acid--CoA ligase [Candidatus Lernaella stagnicola]|nr:long-chain fatty acid--CoA ligase [Candidatus Lernaella stagnicola]
MFSYADLPETNMAAIALNRAKQHRSRVKLISMYRGGRHTGRWQEHTWEDLQPEQFKLNAAWRKLGLKPGDRVAILAGNRPRWVNTFVSLVAGSCVVVPIYPTLTAEAVAYILKDSGARYLVAESADQAEKALSHIESLPRLERVFVMESDGDEADERVASYKTLLALGESSVSVPDLIEHVRGIDPDDPVAIIYTSGTTGRPKGVMLSHNNFLSQRPVLKHFNLNENDVFLNHLPFCHSFGLTADLLASTDVGAVLAIADGIGNEQIRHGLTTIRPTVLMSVPRLFEKLFVEVQRVAGMRPAFAQKMFRNALAVGKQVFDLRNEGKALPPMLALRNRLASRIAERIRRQAGLDRVRIAFAGGGPTSRLLCYFFQGIGIDIYQGYGLTETSPIVTVNIPGKNKLGTVGPPIDGAEVEIAEDGEIMLRGPMLMRGYYNDPESTAEAIDEKRWFHTGDIGHLDADGYLTITDRKKELLVTSGGKNIAPLAIETQFNTEQYLERVVMIGDDRKFLTALVCPNFERVRDWAAGKDLAFESNAELAAHPDVRALMQESVDRVNASLARYEQIKKFAVMDHEFSEATGELTPTMKVKRRIVDKLYKSIIDGMYPRD